MAWKDVAPAPLACLTLVVALPVGCGGGEGEAAGGESDATVGDADSAGEASDAAGEAGSGGSGDEGGDGDGDDDSTPVLPSTGQTECFAESGDAIDCAGTGQDGDMRAGLPMPAPRFLDLGDGTVRDNLTGLVWLRESNCLGEGDWTQALNLSNNLGDGECGLSDGSVAGDWRLPNFIELANLINVSRGYPALSNTDGTGAWTRGDPFTGVQANLHWSSTTSAGNTTKAWLVSPFASGNFWSGPKEESHRIWPVKQDADTANAPVVLLATQQTQCYDAAGIEIDCTGTGQDGEVRAGVPLTTARFTDHGDGTVRDNLTGLLWLKEADCLGEDTLPQAYSLTAGLADGQCGLSDGSSAGDWRVPNFRELFSLLDWSRADPILSNTQGDGNWSEGDPFTGVKNSLHWTSTSLGGDTSGEWMISPYASGNIHGGSKAATRWIWPVRDE